MGPTINLRQTVVCTAIQQLVADAQPVKCDAVAGLSRGTRRDALELVVANLIRWTGPARETASVVSALFVGAAWDTAAGVSALTGVVAKHVLSALATHATAAVITTDLTVAIGTAHHGALALGRAKRGIRAVATRARTTTGAAAVIAALFVGAVGDADCHDTFSVCFVAFRALVARPTRSIAAVIAAGFVFAAGLAWRCCT